MGRHPKPPKTTGGAQDQGSGRRSIRPSMVAHNPAPNVGGTDKSKTQTSATTTSGKVKGRLPKHRWHRPALETRAAATIDTNATKPGKRKCQLASRVQGHAVSAIRIFHVFIVGGRASQSFVLSKFDSCSWLWKGGGQA